MSKIQLIFHERQPVLNERKRLKLFIELMFKMENKGIKKLSIIFCSDDYLLGINREFLKHNFYTDIITFNLSPQGSGMEAEIYISVDRLKDNAKKLNISFIQEIHRVIFHGVIHLCGYKDKTKKEVKLMRQKEDHYLKLYFQ